MERSRAAKSKFKMKSSALRAGESIMGRFMAMGKTLGNSKTDARATIDPSKYYTPPKKKVVEKPESASKILKNRKAQIELDKMNANKADAEYYGGQEDDAKNSKANAKKKDK